MTRNQLTLFFVWNFFRLNEDLRGFEKYCVRVRQNRIRSAWPEERKKQHNRESRFWAEANPERRREISRRSAQNRRDTFPSEAATKMRKRRAADPERNRRIQTTWERREIKNNVSYRLGKYLRNRMNDALARRSPRAGTLLQLLGCSVKELRAHLEKQFRLGMTWENQGEWHIDHKRPCASFDLTDFAQQKACFHYTNLQPLWAHENLSKSDKWPNAS